MTDLQSSFQAQVAQRKAAITTAPIVAQNIENTISLIKEFYGLKTGLSLLDPFNLPAIFQRKAIVDEIADAVRIAVRPMVKGSSLGSVIFEQRDSEHLQYPKDYTQEQLKSSGANKIAGIIKRQMFDVENPARKNSEYLGLSKKIIAQSLLHPEASIETIITTFIDAPSLNEGPN